ncbi:MAG: FG-GAP-like repeat-containing protein [bacterium]|nr:FG-GAP-like repeat-containing protein [bacterium]
MRKTLFILFVGASAVLATISTQTNWNGGDGEEGPVGEWGNKFFDETNTNYSGVAGQLTLKLVSTVNPMCNIIGTDVTEVKSLHVGDIDGDGDADVASAAYGNSGLTWWENTSGDGLAWASHYIGDGGTGNDPHYVWLADLDNDDDLDIVLVLIGAGAVVWWENEDGHGGSWNRHSVDYTMNRPSWVDTADLDGDGDLDIAGAIVSGDEFRVWLNNGDASSWTMYKLIYTMSDLGAPTSIYAADMDDDGDLDLVGCSHWEGDVIWWNNNGGAPNTWPETKITTDFPWAESVSAADMDGDGDTDVVAASAYDSYRQGDGHQVAWWENPGWAEHVVAPDFGPSYYVRTVDLDYDGDYDLLSTACEEEGGGGGDNVVRWFENKTGDGLSWSGHTVEDYFTGAGPCSAIDVTGNGLLETVSAATELGEIAWWQTVKYSNYGELTSSILDKGGDNLDWGAIFWNSSDPDQTTLKVQVRSGDNPGNMGSWSQDITDSYFDLNNIFSDTDRYFQYKVMMVTEDVCATPVLKDISIAYGSDSSPPVIHHTPIRTAPIAIAVQIEATVTDTQGVVGARLYYRATGVADFICVSMTKSGDIYKATIPADCVTERGVEYYLWASDGFNVAMLPSGGADDPYSIQVTYTDEGINPGAPQDSGHTVADYRLFSVPTDYGDDGGAPDFVLEDDLGPYDQKEWRLARYQNDSFVEYTIGDIENFMPGRSYWLIVAAEGVTLDSGAGQSPDTGEPYPITIDPGWNQIANPYAFYVAWSDVLDLDDNSGVSSLLQDPVGYEGSYEYSVGVLESWKGYWVYFDGASPATLYIPPIEYQPESPQAGDSPLISRTNRTAGAPSVLPAPEAEPVWALAASTPARAGVSGGVGLVSGNDSTLTGPARPEASPSAPIDGPTTVYTGEPEWTLELRLDSGGIVDGWNRLGVTRGSTLYWDSLEKREPPYLSGAPNLWFDHDDWPNRRGRYATDWRPTVGEGLEFRISVTPAAGEGEALLSWPGMDDLPVWLDAVLLDTASGAEIDLGEAEDYLVRFTPGEAARELVLFVGGGDWIEDRLPNAPRRTYLQQSYPNPARASVTIAFGLSADGPVELTVYDLAGRRVATLLDGELTAGDRLVSWDCRDSAGRAVPSGVYLYRLVSDEGSLAQRLVIAR